MRVVQPLAQVGVGGLGQAAHLVEEVQQAGRAAALLLRDEPDAAAVVGPRDGAPADALERVELLLRSEDVRVEGRVQPLVGEVDEQLLEAVGGEGLEAEDVEDAW